MSYPALSRSPYLCIAAIVLSSTLYAQNPTVSCSFTLFQLNASDPNNPAVLAVTGVNKSRTAVGYASPNQVLPPAEGFVRAADGTVQYVTPTGSRATWINALNDNGVSVGYYEDPAENDFGFALRGSILTPIPFPPGNRPTGINNANTIVGQYLNSFGIWTGFMRSTDGKITSLTYPGAAGTYPYGINDLGVIVGQYYDRNYSPHGFTYSNGAWTNIDYNLGGGALLLGISDSGIILGESPAGWGFFLYKDGAFASLPSVPGSSGTSFNSMSLGGLLTGTESDSSGQHGFVATCK